VHPSLALLWWELRIESSMWAGIPCEWFARWFLGAAKRENANIESVRRRLWHGDRDFSNSSTPERRETFRQVRHAVLAHLDEFLDEERHK